MKQLRQTIRRIITEWHEHYERQGKIMTLLNRGETVDINQALELSQAMGYIGSFEYSKESSDHYAGGKNIFHHYTLHGPFEEEFLPALRRTKKYGSGPAYFDLKEEGDVVILSFFESTR